MQEPKRGKLTAFNESFAVENPATDNLVKLTFKEQNAVAAFLAVFAQLLPFLNSDYPRIEDKAVLLTQEQYFFYQRCVMAESGKLTLEYLGDSFLKTLRTDEFDFSQAFILGIIPGKENTKRHQNLRPRNRGAFTINPNGKIVSRDEKRPTYTSKEKEGFSQNQSCTHIDELALSTAFGFGKDRHSKLFGLLTHIDDTLMSRLLLNDSGTVSRIFDFSNIGQANSSGTYKQYATQFIFPPAQFKSFKDKNLCKRQNDGGTNEVLARLRFNPYRSVICICTDTLEARLLAEDFAQELLHHFSIYAESQGFKLNPHFKIPIIFYVPKNSNEYKRHTERLGHELKFYTPAMLEKDRAEAVAIYKDKMRRRRCYQNQDYEFLLGLESITAQNLLESIDAVPLALAMIRNGKVRMLMRVLRASTQPNICDRVFDALLADGLIIQNDPIIAQLIVAEAFDIANKIINATKTIKAELKYKSVLLIDHLIRSGNPRHFHFMGFDQMLMKAAKMRAWVSVSLYLKEYGHQEVRNSNVETSRESLNASDYGYALFEALQDQQLKLAKFFLKKGAKSTWRNQQTEYKYQLLSTLYFAINFDYNDFLPNLIEHEKEGQNEYYEARLRLSLDLAYCCNNKTAVALLEKISQLVCIDPENIQIGICMLLHEALIVGDRKIFELRLIRYCHQYKLLPENNHNILDGLEILQAQLAKIVSKDTQGFLTEIIMQRDAKPSSRLVDEDEYADIVILKSDKNMFMRALIDQRYREADLLYTLTMTAEDFEREFHRQVKIKAWKYVEFFSRYHTDTNDTLGYSYALLKALKHQQPRLAKLLLQAGAKANWLKWKTGDDHPLESALLHAIDYDYHELVPQLIELELGNSDDSAPRRLRLALDLAYVRRNHEAISLLEGANIQAPFMDPANVVNGLCVQVLEAFSLGKREVGQLRLLRYCHTYNLMAKDHRRVVDGLDIIKNCFTNTLQSYAQNEIIRSVTLLFEIIMSDLKTELLASSLGLLDFGNSGDSEEEKGIRKAIYSTIIKYLTNDNFKTVHRIVIDHESKKGFHRCNWRSAIADEYNKRISSNSRSLGSGPYSRRLDPVTTLIYKLGINLSSYTYFQSFEYAVDTGNEELCILLLNHSLSNPAVQERSLVTAIERGNAPLILSLMNNTQFTITIDLILAAIKHDDFLVLLVFLKASDIKRDSKKAPYWTNYTKWTYGFPQEYRWTLYSIWAYASLPDDRRRACCKLLTRLLRPSLAMHFTIINVLVILSSEPSLELTEYNVAHVLTLVKPSVSIFKDFAKKHNLKYNPEDRDAHLKILNILGRYLAETVTLLDDAVIVSTFKEIQEYFNTLYNKSFTGSFFKIRPKNQRDYNTEIYNTLRDVAEALKNSDAPDEEPTIENNDQKETSIVHGKN